MRQPRIHLCAWRRQKGLNQKGLSILSGLTQATISRIESSSAMPRLATLSKIASTIGITLEELLGYPPPGKDAGLSRFVADKVARAIASGIYPKEPRLARLCRDLALWIGEKLHAQDAPGWHNISRQRLHNTRRAIRIRRTYAPSVLNQVLWRVNKILAGGMLETKRH